MKEWPCDGTMMALGKHCYMIPAHNACIVYVYFSTGGPLHFAAPQLLAYCMPSKTCLLGTNYVLERAGVSRHAEYVSWHKSVASCWRFSVCPELSVASVLKTVPSHLINTRAFWWHNTSLYGIHQSQQAECRAVMDWISTPLVPRTC